MKEARTPSPTAAAIEEHLRQGKGRDQTGIYEGGPHALSHSCSHQGAPETEGREGTKQESMKEAHTPSPTAAATEEHLRQREETKQESMKEACTPSPTAAATEEHLRQREETKQESMKEARTPSPTAAATEEHLRQR
ncbi:hypothetical protein NDU88_006000 [Pleurodeles waltl]|uniref:Uncharacterized protein n=1 Tax=Pleurodeles waltl TaxID=8319 RepID=A0AAV7L2H8_PLEWA|nr:hypothetical protein NDU88_006000 [Pleurodeles waltl]